MANKQIVAAHSRATVLARFAFVTIAALSFFFVQSLQTSVYAKPKKGKPAPYGRIKIYTSTGRYPLRIEGDASNKTRFITPENETTQTFERVYQLDPGKYTVEIAFSKNERWVREFVIEGGRIYCIGLGYTERTTTIKTPEYCKPFGQVTVAAQPTFEVGGEPITFKATVASYSGEVEPIYTWTVSAGSIMRGQGTSEIEVDTAGVSAETKITATVSVDEGSGRPLPPGSTLMCHAVANATVAAKVKPFEAFSGIAFDDVKARLDNFVIDLQSAPDATAYVIYYSGQGCPSGQRSSLGDRSVEYMINTRGFDRSRVKLIDGGKSIMDWMELWVLPAGRKPPTPRPDFPLSGDPDAPRVSKANKQYPCVKSPIDEPRPERPRY
jgi:hypothetical protein